MIKDLIKETFIDYINILKARKSTVFKVLGVSIILTVITSYLTTKYLVPIFRSYINTSGDRYNVDLNNMFGDVLFYILICIIVAMMLSIVFIFTLSSFTPLYCTVGLLILYIGVLMMGITNEVFSINLFSIILSYIILILSFRSFVRFAFNRVILN